MYFQPQMTTGNTGNHQILKTLFEKSRTSVRRSKHLFLLTLKFGARAQKSLLNYCLSSICVVDKGQGLRSGILSFTGLTLPSSKS